MKLARGAVGLVLVLVMAARSASASSPADVATARELYKQGADALDAGNASVAVEKLTAAWALLQTPVIGLALARAHMKLGHLIEGSEAAYAVMRMPKAADETSLSAAARGDAEKLAESLRTLVPHVTFVVRGATRDETTVKLDGAAIPAAALSVPRQANPGTHTVVADTTDGRHAQASITLAESETKEVTLTLPPTESAAKPEVTQPSTVPSAAATAGEQRRATVSPVVWVGVVIGGVGLVVGAVAGGLALGATGALERQCTSPGSDGKSVCPTSSAGDLSLAQTGSTVSTIGFIGLGVGLATLVTGLFLGHGHGAEPRAHATMVPMLGPVSGLSGTF